MGVSGFRGQGLGFRVGFREQSTSSRAIASLHLGRKGLGFRDLGGGFRVLGGFGV